MSDNVIPLYPDAGHTSPAAPPAPPAMATPVWVSTTTEPLRAALSGVDQPHIGPATIVLPTGQQPDAVQRAGRYLPETLRHPQRTLPALAVHAIDRYTQAGQTVFAPFAGSGTILVEAIHAGRRAAGIDIDPRWVELTAANVMFAQQHGATGEVLLAEEDARDIGPQPRWLRGRVDLVVATPPARLSPTDNPARRWSNAEVVDQLQWDLVLCLDAWMPLLHDGSILVFVTRLVCRAGQRLDLTVPIAHAADQRGLVFVERAAALRTPLRERVRPTRRRHGSRRRPSGVRVVHEDVVTFKVPRTRWRRR